ncbi:FkbM family methyltransferase [Peribacillus frigoritolerans]|uniref:FkbM family methyltransferase n=1 Tax=Peribacillus frigoritolerans TaxID=450367 RepID=A0AAJ1QNC4_9BACI|nr:FkbM family methyltransferase [Peribacillus frigoritolerans]MDM5284692.1 FkbM family methyltransferase [Peribacillus frigoritolerans]
MMNFESEKDILKCRFLLDNYNLDTLYNLAIIEFKQENYEDSLRYLALAKKICKDEDDTKLNFYIIENNKKLKSGELSKPILNKSFLDRLVDEIVISLANNYYDNVDYVGMDAESPDIFNINLKISVNDILNHLDGISFLFQQLKDEKSKDLLLKIMAYRILGHHKVKLPLNNTDYWKERKFIDSLKCTSDNIKVNFRNWIFYLFDLTKIGFDLKLYSNTVGVQTNFVQKQYSHPEVKVEKGDYVIDAGGCYGDTALFFAHEVGMDGKVFSFEFIESNLSIFEKNININKNLSKRISIIKNPVWETSGIDLYLADMGPASIVSYHPFSSMKVKTISIDDFVFENKVPKIDFIKMDIEGAELNALKGAKTTILRHQPKLAICLYHNAGDFSQIFEYIMKLGINYKFYLGHFTIWEGETVLFAQPLK